MKNFENSLAANTTTVENCVAIQLPTVGNRAGNLTIIENPKQIPFTIERVYYLYDVPAGGKRGGHAHKELEQVLIAISGSFDVVLKDGFGTRTEHLGLPDKGLYLTPGIWRELENFSSGAICLVLASQPYDEHDYQRDFQLFRETKML